MAKISASNSVVKAVESAAALFSVRCYRMNSRTFTVVGAGGRERPMFMGMWRDEYGTEYRKGMADLLLTPRIDLFKAYSIGAHVPTPIVPMNTRADVNHPLVAVPLWVECKSGSGELSKEQKLFRDDVLKAGAFHIEAHDSADAVIAWFEKMGVKR